jgi:hypothetical protein
MGARRITAVIHLGAAGLAMLLAGSRPSWGQGQAEDFAAAPAVPAAMHQLFDMPRAQLGTTRGQLQRALGQAGRISAREVANVYESGVVDRIWTLVFDGATAEVYEARAMARVPP